MKMEYGHIMIGKGILYLIQMDIQILNQQAWLGKKYQLDLL